MPSYYPPMDINDDERFIYRLPIDINDLYEWLVYTGQLEAVSSEDDDTVRPTEYLNSIPITRPDNSTTGEHFTSKLNTKFNKLNLRRLQHMPQRV